MGSRLFALIVFVLLPLAASGQGKAAGAPSASEAPETGAEEVAAPPKARDLPFSRENVLAIVTSHADQIQGCYEDAMARRGSTAKTAPAGRVVLSWTITLQGLPADVKVKKTEIQDTLVTECMVQAIRFWEFPRPEVPQPIEFPFELKAFSGAKAGAGKKDGR